MPTPTSNDDDEQTNDDNSPSNKPSFVYLANSTRHSIGITAEGVAYSWGRSNAFGQLGRNSNSNSNTTSSCKVPGPVTSLLPTKARKAYVSEGCTSDTGHSAILDETGMLWMAGCDRWQQLGLGSSKAGSSGYTWKDGKLWQERFVPSISVSDLMKEKQQQEQQTTTIRDVALGGDHTLVLASNQRDVYAFGKGGDGQLGVVGKRFVSAPIRSTFLSEAGVAAVCAVSKCSMTLDDRGRVKNQVGRCRSVSVTQGLSNCIARAKRDGLIHDDIQNEAQSQPE